MGHQCRIIVVTWVVDSTEALEEVFWTILWINHVFGHHVLSGEDTSFRSPVSCWAASIPALRWVYLHSPVYSSCGVLFVYWLILHLVWNKIWHFDSALPFPAFGSRSDLMDPAEQQLAVASWQAIQILWDNMTILPQQYTPVPICGVPVLPMLPLLCLIPTLATLNHWAENSMAAGVLLQCRLVFCPCDHVSSPQMRSNSTMWSVCYEDECWSGHRHPAQAHLNTLSFNDFCEALWAHFRSAEPRGLCLWLPVVLDYERLWFSKMNEKEQKNV